MAPPPPPPPAKNRRSRMNMLDLKTTRRSKTKNQEQPLSTPMMPLSPRAALPVHPDNLAFAKKLKDLMRARGMSSSDLARAIWGTTPDPRGYPVARNRDRIGTYLAGTGLPSKETLPKLVAALGTTLDELALPVRSTRGRTFSSSADVTFTLLASHPGICSMRIVKLLPIDVGLKILELVNSAQSVASEEVGAHARADAKRGR